MRGARQFVVMLMLVVVVGGGRASATPAPHEVHVPADAVATVPATIVDTATEVALYGLVSWADSKDAAGKPILVALMPDTSVEPQCLGEEDPPHRHHPVLKIVTGTPSWTGDPLPPLGAHSRVFSLAGQDVTIGPGDFVALAKEGFDLLSSDTSLNLTKSATIPTAQQARLRVSLLDDVLANDTRLGARVRFTKGKAIASVDRCDLEDPVLYLAERNTKIDDGGGRPDCPTDETMPPLPRRLLAEEMVVRLKDAGNTLTVNFREWKTGKQRTLTVQPAFGGVRIELSHQMQVAAETPDSRDEELCELRVYLEDYLWYYDLRDGANCPTPTLFPCNAGLGGTKCPEHLWEG